MNVLVAGGGTGGHVVPLLAVSARLKRRGADVLVVGHGGGIAQAAADAGLEFAPISAGKLRRYWSLQNFIDPFRTLWGIWQCWRLIGRFKPDVVFGKGGYAAFPAVYAARWRRIPVVIHESDVEPGLGNKLSAKYADVIALSWPLPEGSSLPADKVVVTGNPLRDGVISGKVSRAQAQFKLSSELPVVLALGGSQGSAQINHLVAAALPQLLPEAQIVHQVGNQKVSELPKLAPELTKRYHVKGSFGDELFDLYAAADLVITRGGVGALGELAAAGKPMIIMPHERGSGGSGHQSVNAEYFAQHGAGVVVSSATTDPAELIRVVKQLLHDGTRRARMARAAKSLARLDATDKLAELVWKAGERQ